MTAMSNSKKPWFSQDSQQAFRNPWVIGWVIAVLFVVGVNVVFITTAFMTSPGLVEEDYYEKGRDHEKNFQKKMTAHQRLGWEMSLNPVAKPMMGKPVQYSFSVVDKSGLPVKGLDAKLLMYRPSDAKADFTLAMEELGPGLYTAAVTFPLKGIWEVTAKASQGEEYLKLTQRLNVIAPGAQ